MDSQLENMMAKFAIVDVANLFFRVRHVVRGDVYEKVGMTLHTVFQSLRKLYREQECDHVVLCLEGRSWRYDIYPSYKSKRRLDQAESKLKDEEEEQVFFQTMDEFVTFMSEKTRCTVLQSQGVEGDDFIARWVQLHPDDNHVILSGDTDFIQLLAPNVSIYNGVDQRLITSEGVFNESGDPLVFTVNGSTGKLKVGLTIEKAKEAHEKDQREKERNHKADEKKRAAEWVISEKIKASEDPEYKIKPFVGMTYDWQDFSFEIESEWWKKALFVKIIRGDTSDSVFSAYPGVRYTSKSTVGIKEAWENRFTKDFHWNNFMLSTWEKAIGVNADGEPISKKVTVREEFAINEILIDLTKQPQTIKDLMDTVIVQAVQKEPVNNVGIQFLKFCNKFDLKNLSRDAHDHAMYLMKGYQSS
jgi:hypothetical protein